jgi:tetratricopeptide (TPR) repeat protein
VRLVAIALGGEQGAPVPDATRGLRGGGGLRDAQGRPVLSRRDAERLARWAAATGGASFAGDRWGAIDLAAALGAIRRDAGHASGEPVARRVPALQTVPLAALAFALLWLEWTGLPGARGRLTRPVRPRRRAPAAAATALATLLLGAAPGDEPAAAPPDPHAVARLEAALRARPGDPELLVELGVARAEAGDPAGAGHALRAAALTARDPALAALAWYDLGVLAIDARELEAARDAFLEALALAPDDARARFNLEWALRALAEPPPPPAPGRDEQQEQDEQERGEAEPSPRAPAQEGEDEAPAESPADEAGEQAPPRFAPQLAEQEVERWLDEVHDSAGAALRAATEAGEPTGRRRPAVGW